MVPEKSRDWEINRRMYGNRKNSKIWNRDRYKKRYSVKKLGQREVEKDNEGDRFYISYNTISSVPWKEDSEAKQPTYLVSSTIVSSSWYCSCCCCCCCFGDLVPTFFFVAFDFFDFFDFKVDSKLGLYYKYIITIHNNIK